MSDVPFFRESVRHEPAARELTVAATERLTSTITRVTLAGEALDGFAARGPEDHVKLVFPAPAGQRILRDYTPAVFDEAARQLSIDFVVHGEEGPATRFAANARPGDPIVVAGPRGSRLPPQGARRYVLIADEAALPALARWVDAVRWDAEVLAFVQSDAADVLDYPIPTGDRVRVTRIATGADAVLSALEGPGIDDSTYVWAAGEATALIPVRRLLRRERGLGKERAKVDGYWRLGEAGRDHHAPLDPADPED